MDVDTTRQLQTEPEAVAISKSLSILKSDTINDNTFHRSQSKRAATLAKLQPLISATTQITKPNDELTTTTTSMTAMSTNSRLLNAVAVAAPWASVSSINNISNNSDQQRWTTVSTMPPSVLGVTAALQANLIMSNRNVEEQKLDEHEYKITQNSNALFVPSSNIYSNSNNSTATTFGLAGASQAEESTTTTTTATTTTTTTTTTRRPAPRTTLKPPPTIDDYQTIISQAGTHAYLPCNVKQLVKKPISWLRMRDGHILTVDQTTFIADQRFQSVFSPNPERWSLQIKYVQLKDEGTYECQVSTEPKASAIVHLRIVEPKTELIGESTRHVKAGSQVKLRCIISQALEPPLFINWFYNQKQIYLHNRRGWRTEIERIDLPTEVPTTSTAPTTSTSTSTSATMAAISTATAKTSAPTATATATAAETINDIAAITRSYILDAIAVGYGTSMAGYGYVLPTTATPMHTTATMSTATATATAAAAAADAGAVEIAAGVATAAAAVAADTPAILTWPATATTAATTSEAATTRTTAATATTTTTTTSEPSTTTTTMLPSSSFIKQITTASLIIPAVVKLDSGNYTCSPSNSAPRTIVLHVLNGEYSASAIKSASVSWNTLIGCPGYLRWPNVSTILTLLWIIKFVLGRNVTACCNRGRNKVNNRPALQEPATTTAITKATTGITCRTTASKSVSVSVNRRLSTQSESQTTTRRQRSFGLDCGCGCCCCCGGDCGHVSSSISGTKVAEDKT
ncbi:mucin-5AC [Drosophila innubila]|uniref:mucin-5AC n=1 Tax=Drosophila innubila TaxID=198719 RepID=UPI00148D67C1|nr:mucin-5AC [Drosophila innubila]